MNLRIVEGNFRIYFVDTERHVVSPPFKKARLDLVEFKNKTHETTLSLSLSEDGNYLGNKRRIIPPYRFWVRLVLRDEGNVDNNRVFSRTQFKQ